MSADFLLYDENGKLTACVGITGMRESSEEFATEIMSHFLGFAEPPYLLLVARDQTYFWCDPARDRNVVGVVPTAVLLQNYLGDFNVGLDELASSALEATVLNWLWDATLAVGVPELLRRVGFQDAVRHGRVELASAA